MAFFKSFQHNLPSVNISSILDSVSSRVDDLANAVSDVTYAVSDQLTEQVTTIINKVQEEEDGGNASGQESGQTSAAPEGKPGTTGSKNNQTCDTAEPECPQSQQEWEWRDGCWRVKKTEAQLEEEERRKNVEKELQDKRERKRKEKREKRLEKEAQCQESKEDSHEGQEDAEEAGDLKESDVTSAEDRRGGDRVDQKRGDECDDPPQSSGPETDTRLSKEKGEEKEEMGSLEREGDDEEETELSRSSSKTKKKKSDKKRGKGGKEDAKKSDKDADVEKKNKKKKKKKKKAEKGNQG